jgi:hypothetical protein
LLASGLSPDLAGGGATGFGGAAGGGAGLGGGHSRNDDLGSSSDCACATETIAKQSAIHDRCRTCRFWPLAGARSMRLTTRVRLSPAVAVALLVSTTAVAAPIDDAKKAFADGKAAFERGDFETALASYQRANMILPAPNLYYNIGATYERLGRYQEAALAFDKYFELAGAPQNDEDRAFQDKLRSRTEGDRKRPNLPPPRTQPAPAPQPPPAAPPQQPPQYPQQPPLGYYPGYYVPPPGPPREVKLRQARSRRTRAIVLMGIGVPLCLAGIGITGWAASSNDGVTEGTGIFFGASAFVVGVTLWAPGAASFVKSSRDVATLSKPDPLAPQPLPPGARGF